MVSNSPRSAPSFGAKHGIFQWVRRLATRLPLEAQAACCPAALPVENASNGGVGVMLGQPTHERDGVLVGAHRGLALHR
jgi:hypothetical protein